MIRRRRGFTLIEILVVLGLMLLFGLVAVSFSIPLIQRGQTDSLIDDMESLSKLYQQHAYTGKNGKSYGVHFESSSYSVFVGESFAGAESFDTVNLPGDTSIVSVQFADNGNDIVFSSGTFKPSTTGIVRVSNGIDAFVLEFNREGLISSYRE